MRGRLVFRFLAQFYPLDTAAIEAGGYYDEDFGSISKTDSDSDGIGESNRQEGTAYTIPCQVEDNLYSRYNASLLGDLPSFDMVLVVHFSDLEANSMIDADGTPDIKKGDRLNALQTIHGTAVQTMPNPPGMYVVESRAVSFGLNMADPRRNLLLVFLKQRSSGVQ
jgi:hypothetical protein